MPSAAWYAQPLGDQAQCDDQARDALEALMPVTISVLVIGCRHDVPLHWPVGQYEQHTLHRTVPG
ncbi:MAG TPA: hypothetical protein DHU96_19130 [Actinobacteria bacterium]|nr:hypothetical protein [Actinomycetota bacterium]